MQSQLFFLIRQKLIQTVRNRTDYMNAIAMHGNQHTYFSTLESEHACMY